jgi:hypothetical protein
MNTHTITISKFKHFPAFSEETVAFTCDVLMDGKKIGHAKNEGHGGETVFYGSSPMGFGERSKISDIVDGFVSEAIVDKHKEKDKKSVARKLAKALYFRIKGQKDGAYYIIKADPSNPKVRENANKNGDLDIIINDLPINEAVKFFYRYE